MISEEGSCTEDWSNDDDKFSFALALQIIFFRYIKIDKHYFKL